jgi:hypothetical protein
MGVEPTVRSATPRESDALRVGCQTKQIRNLKTDSCYFLDSFCDQI